MILFVILVSSVVLQFAAALLALRLIRVTRKHRAWLLIAAALALMAMRRAYILVQLMSGSTTVPLPDLTGELIALTTSIFMVFGVGYIAPVFLAVQEANQALQENRAVLQAILDASPVGIVLIRDRVIQWANQAMERMFGHAKESYQGQSTALFYPDIQEYERVGKEIYPMVAHHEQGGMDVRLRRRDGSVFDGSVHVRALDSEDLGKGYIAALTDLTERKELEQQIIQSQKMEAIGRLAGGVAHDFNNLLTSIMGYSDLLATKLPPDSPQRRYVGEVRKASELAAALTRQLLTFSRKQVLQPCVLYINDVISEMRLMLEKLLGEGVTLELDLAPALGCIRSDHGQIEQVILNLLVNSRDAMPLGGSITIATANVDLDADFAGSHLAVTAGPHVMLTVSDTGEGMAEDTRRRMFEPFFTTKEKGKGTGLGLATTYAIVKQSGGTLWVDSEIGRGTTIKIYFPRVDEDRQVETRLAEPCMRTDGTETILLAEDERAVRDLAGEMLQKCGYTVLEAVDGEDAVRIAEGYGQAIDMLLTDVVMPGMNGRELAERLTVRRPAIKILYISGYTDNVIAQHGILDPGTQFLAKPFTQQQLARKVREVLDSPVFAAVSCTK
ncbi:MAG TPA: hybrid sensor histidine kinase/response regulator [Syntrophobacteraceae bacterium]|nr:hybrid sensor histidine kinase/response regulator [Syntrophobacteraceae bacterium]HBD10258.1 hybrid sensor histidine kinase/response regulator [Syntrophobacteraceae bacterium]HBZ56095.1 hybrid sensor histidine kinase/response regulator [Syntrophobacteraceae bacterium]